MKCDPLEELARALEETRQALGARARFNDQEARAISDRARSALSRFNAERGKATVDFYEREFYPLSNFSAFTLMWPVSPREGVQRFDTSEQVYHWEKFRGNVPTGQQRAVQMAIREAASAHEAFKIAERNREFRRPKWDEEKVEIMRRIIAAKAEQHEYVRRKLLETGDRPLIEGSWRDDFWGIGPNGDGQNILGKLWMELRASMIAATNPETQHEPS